MAQIYRTGLTELHSGAGPNGEPPKVSIVFIHGLGGHPVRTWSALSTISGSDASDRRPSDSSESSSVRDASTSRKGSLWSKFKRSKTGTLGERSMSTYSMDAMPSALSPQESNVDPLSAEPDELRSPAISPRVPTLNPMSRTSSNITVPITASAASRRQSVYWLRDLLPADIPRASIFTYGYDADVVKKPFGKDTLAKDRESEADTDAGAEDGPKGKLNFAQHAHDLMVTLNRQLPGDVPIILCAHSLGGVLAKRALCESNGHTQDPLKRKLAKFTKAIFFFGTPHKGSSTASWGVMGTKIVSLMNIEVTSHLVKNLKLDSQVLDIIHSDFMQLLAEGRFWVHTFQEGRAINNVIGKVVEDYSSKIDETPLQQYEKIDGNHRTMIQFKNAQERGYRRIKESLLYYMAMLDSKHDAERRSLASAHSAKSIQTPTYHMLPYTKNADFVGRVDTLEQINMLFAGPKFTSFVALHGLGGIGKTQVAVELANRWKNFFPSYSIFWIHATKQDVFDDGLTKIAEELGIPPSADTNVRNLVQKWLVNPANGKWLLIIDNVDDKKVLDANKGMGKFKMIPCIPKTGHGHVLFTTRYKSVALDLARDNVRLDPMSKLEALDLMKATFADDWEDDQTDDAYTLLEELSYIPLAIVHASCYMRENGTSMSRYLKMYRDSEESREELLEEEVVGLLSEADDQTPKTVLNTTWMSLDRLQADGASGPLAIDLLSVMVFLHRQDVPLWLLEKFRPKISAIKMDKAFGALKGYNMVTENTKAETFTMHRLVQLSMRRWLEQGEREGQADQYREEAFKLVSAHFPDGSFSTWKKCKQLIIHADVVLEESAETEDRAARANLLETTANFQNGRGQYAVAEKKLVEVVELKTELSGPESEEALKAQDALAWTLRSQAKKDEALKLAQDVQSAKERLFGKDNPSTLTTAHICATIIGDQGKHQEAANLHQTNYDARKQLLGPEHLETLRSAASLALELWELGRFVEAEELARDTLSSRTRILSDEHPDTLEIAGTLGFILEIQGKYAEARELKENMLSVRRRIYGDEHPDTADSLHDMGWILHQMGQYEEADPYYEQSLAAKERLLGDEHWKTLTTRCNYPVFFTDMGRYDEAEVRSKALIETFKRVQGPQHPQTLDCTGGLAVILRHQGKLEEAAAAARTSIDGRNIVLGPDHPWTQPPISHWGYILTLQGEHKKGEETIREALGKLEKHMGAESSNTLTSVVFLSKNLLLQATSNPDRDPSEKDRLLDEAEQLAQRAVTSRKKLLGEDHPYTYKTMHHHAKVMFARGNHEAAIEVARHGLGGLRRVLGGELGVEHADVSRADIDLREMEEKLADMKKGEDKGSDEGDGKDEVLIVDI